jgi:hypothetical protein
MRVLASTPPIPHCAGELIGVELAFDGSAHSADLPQGEVNLLRAFRALYFAATACACGDGLQAGFLLGYAGLSAVMTEKKGSIVNNKAGLMSYILVRRNALVPFRRQ